MLCEATYPDGTVEYIDFEMNQDEFQRFVSARRPCRLANLTLNSISYVVSIHAQLYQYEPKIGAMLCLFWNYHLNRMDQIAVNTTSYVVDLIKRAFPKHEVLNHAL